jgi:hypothetical protein
MNIRKPYNYTEQELSINEINDFLNFIQTEGEIGLPDEELLVSELPSQLELDLDGSERKT